MTQEKPRATRARKTTATTETVAETMAVAKAPARPRTRKKAAAVAPAPEAVAFRAYLLWEQGEPGTPEEHWLRAERELVAA
jgi:hypothetical protein